MWRANLGKTNWVQPRGRPLYPVIFEHNGTRGSWRSFPELFRAVLCRWARRLHLRLNSHYQGQCPLCEVSGHNDEDLFRLFFIIFTSTQTPAPLAKWQTEVYYINDKTLYIIKNLLKFFTMGKNDILKYNYIKKNVLSKICFIKYIHQNLYSPKMYFHIFNIVYNHNFNIIYNIIQHMDKSNTLKYNNIK